MTTGTGSGAGWFADGLVFLLALVVGGLAAAVAGWVVGLPSRAAAATAAHAGRQHDAGHAVPQIPCRDGHATTTQSPASLALGL